MSQERLSGLAMISIEKEYLDMLEYDDIIDEFAAKKSRRSCFCWIYYCQKMRNMFNFCFNILYILGVFVMYQLKEKNTLLGCLCFFCVNGNKIVFRLEQPNDPNQPWWADEWSNWVSERITCVRKSV